MDVEAPEGHAMTDGTVLCQIGKMLTSSILCYSVRGTLPKANYDF